MRPERIFGSVVDGESAKIDECLDILEQCKASKHKVLVFSQFKSMLDILIKESKKAGISSVCINGSVTKEQRKSRIKKLQEGDVDVFFISLKAGGTGLNLTAADRVIHFDP